ncbi:hypothetical protein ACRE_052320 [Hapsidospora chrysogenum ATCC 11550]|uniref:Uncharacterized protein n=1 Tax=Hapsidospora chrysogenum (strain ATCC 11550 / CBS 779.69 / DSM 880 / IAM 14645 / JCM 23072 / IMI 49137) TaxID=857340 RepID=A0A086T3P8_HAPC1|nr:hypothetical protein ACRE_052320 [Hapsidospora chrysogenum ATCC 11550]
MGSVNNFTDDYVYAVHPIDGTKIQHVLYAGFERFNDVLDPQKIHDALFRLLQIGDWKKLGGRLRYRGDKLEIHVPREYTSDRPPFLFAHEAFDDTSIFDHPTAGQFPRSSHGLCLRSLPHEDICRLAMGPGFPRCIEEAIDKDVPQLGLKIITFADATLLVTIYPHITWDAFGYLALKKMMQYVLEGREDEVSPMLGAQEDVLSEIARPYRNIKGGEEEDPLLSRMKQVNQANQANQAQAAGNPSEPPPPRPEMDSRVMCIPREVSEKLHQHLRQESSDNDDDGYDSLRSDEVMAAWVIQQLSRASPAPRPMALMNLVNVRFIVPSVAKAQGVYTQNMLLVASNNLPPDTATGPVGPIAHSQRASIAHMAEPKNTAQFLAAILGAIEANVDTTAMSSTDASATPVLVNNLTSITSGMDLDYSAALVRQGESPATRTNPLGTVDFGYIADVTNPYPYPKLTMVGSMTGDGTCWMFGELPEEAWVAMEEYLAELSY